MGNQELAEKEVQRTKVTSRHERAELLIGSTPEQRMRFYEDAEQRALPFVIRFRDEYSSHLILPEQLKQEVLELALSVKRLCDQE